MDRRDSKSSEGSESVHGRKEYIEKQWTKLLHDWVRICGHRNLNQEELMDVLRMYGDDIFLECQPLPQALDRFLRRKYPKLQLKLSKERDLSRDPYITATVILYHCITSGPVDVVINICLYLSLEQQTLVQRFCERLKDVDVTISNIDAAIAGAFEGTPEISENESGDINVPFNLRSSITEHLINIGMTDEINSQGTSSYFKRFNSELKNALATCAPVKTTDTPFLKPLFAVQSADSGYPGKTNNLEGTSTRVLIKKEDRKNFKDERNNAQENRNSFEENDPSQASHNKRVTKETVDTLYKSSFVVKSSTFAYTGNTSSEKSISNMALVTTGQSKQLVKGILDVTSTKVLIKEEEHKNKMPQATPVPKAVGEIIDTLFLKAPFTTKSSVMENPSKHRDNNVTEVASLAVSGSKCSKSYTDQEREICSVKYEISKITESLKKPETSAAIKCLTTEESSKERKCLDMTCNMKENITEEDCDKIKKDCNTLIRKSETLKTDDKSQELTAGSQKEIANTDDLNSPFTFDYAGIKQPYCVMSGMKEVKSKQSNALSAKDSNLNTCEHSVKEKTTKQKRKAGAKGVTIQCPCDVCTCKQDSDNHGCNCIASTSKSKESKQRKLQQRFPMPNPLGKKDDTGLSKILLPAIVIMIMLSIIIASIIFFLNTKSTPTTSSDLKVIARRHALLNREEKNSILLHMNTNPNNQWFSWECKQGLCQRVYQPARTGEFKSLSRCTLICTGPQLWPQPIGSKSFGNQLVALAKNKLQYKFIYVPSPEVYEYLTEAFNIFQRDLARLEVAPLKTKQRLDLVLKGLYIEVNVENDPDPKLRLDTEESYNLTVKTTDKVTATINSPSFCGVRHGLETLSQLILLDQSTGYLITLTRATIKDAPTYKYRGLMIDTARNYIPLIDLLRTIDAMAMCKLNTFHWRISDANSFPMLMPEFPQLFENGACNREMVYTTEDIKLIVKTAGYRGIRVLIEVAAPGPGRAWSWISDEHSTKEKTGLKTVGSCLSPEMRESIFDVLEAIYAYIIKLTMVNDIFHLSNNLFSFVDCFDLMDREGLLEEALVRLRIANNGILPRLPLMWYDANIMSKSAWIWHNFGVQLHGDELPGTVLKKYKLVQSSRWDLSCEMSKHRCVKYRTWQQMYSWKKWQDLEVLTIEGGEAMLWTDLVDTNNLDSQLWPRAAAVAERLWSDAVANQSTSPYEYLRIDAQRWRMLIRGVKIQPIWPVWCNFNPVQCFSKIKT